MIWLEAELEDKMDDAVKSHDFGETGYFYNSFVVVASDDLCGGMFYDDEALSSDVAEISLSYVKQLFSLELLNHFLSVLAVQVSLLHDFLFYPQLYLLIEVAGITLCGSLAVGAVDSLVAAVMGLFIGGAARMLVGVDEISSFAVGFELGSAAEFGLLI